MKLENYNFKIHEKYRGLSSFKFVTFAKTGQLTVSKAMLDLIKEDKFYIFSDKDKDAIFLKYNPDGRNLNKGYACSYISSRGLDMPFGRYYFEKELDGGYLFLKKD